MQGRDLRFCVFCLFVVLSQPPHSPGEASAQPAAEKRGGFRARPAVWAVLSITVQVPGIEGPGAAEAASRALRGFLGGIRPLSHLVRDGFARHSPAESPGLPLTA